MGGCGFVIRDDRGNVVRSGAGHDDSLLHPFHAELLGCLAGIQEAANMGVQQICMETDATQVKEALENEEYRLSAIGGFIVELKFL